MTIKMLTGGGFIGGTITTTTAVQFFALGGAGFGSNFPWSAESHAQITARVAGTFTNAGIRVFTGAAGTHTAGLRKNGASGTLVISVTASTTGWFSDSTHTDTIASGDTICGFVQTTASFSESFSQFSIQFSPTTGATTWYAFSSQGDNLGQSSASTTNYWPIAGMSHNSAGFYGTETSAQVRVRAAGTLSRLQIFIKTNTSVNAATFRTRKNTANGGQSVSITAATTGLFEDASNTDSVVATDLTNYSITTGASTVGLTISMFSVQFTSAVTGQDITTGITSPTGISATVTTYWNIFGWTAASTTEVGQKTKIPFICTLSNARLRVTSNSSSIAETFKCRINGADGAQSASITASTAGIFEDITNTDSISAGDDVNYAISAGNNANVLVSWTAMTMDAAGAPGGGGGSGRTKSNSVVLG